MKLEAPDGKLRATDCVDTEGLLRIIQSIPSPNAEPLELWLARIGRERMQDMTVQPVNWNVHGATGSSRGEAKSGFSSG